MIRKQIDKIVRHAWIDVIIDVEDNSIFNIAKKTKHSYSYILLVIKDMEKRGWITPSFDGYKYKVTLTEKGKEIREKALSLFFSF